MRRVILESPFGAPDWRTILDNIDYARRCVRDALQKGDAPFASHLLYTQAGILDDRVPDERTWGIAAGFVWMRVAEAVVVYTDRGISPGMESGIRTATALTIPVEYRKIGEN